MVRVKRRQPADQPSLRSELAISATVVGYGKAAARVSNVLRRAGYRCEVCDGRGTLRGSDVVVVCCFSDDAWVGHIEATRQGGDARPIIVVGHKQPCAFCDSALENGADMWIPQTPLTLLELQLSRSVWLLARRVSRLRAGHEVQLRPKECQLLKYLVSRAGLWTTEQELLEEVLGYGPRHDTTVVRVHLCSLRKAMGRFADCIETRRGLGYRFSASCARSLDVGAWA